MTNPKKIDDERIEVTVVKHKDEILAQLQRQLKLEKDVERELVKIRDKIAILKSEAVLKLTYYEDTGEEVVDEEVIITSIKENSDEA